MTHIEKLLDKYSSPYVQGEKRSRDYEQMIRQERQLKKRKQIAKYLKYQSRYLIINDSDLEQVNYLIETFNKEFNNLYNGVGEETIILAFIFFVLQDNGVRLNLEDYHICTDYNLNDKNYGLIVTRMLHYFMKQKPLTPVETTSYDHEILYENHGRI